MGHTLVSGTGRQCGTAAIDAGQHEGMCSFTGIRGGLYFFSDPPIGTQQPTVAVQLPGLLLRGNVLLKEGAAMCQRGSALLVTA